MSTLPLTFPFPNGTVLQSSASTPQLTETMFQVLTLQILNIAVNPKTPETAYKQVRVGWQKDGQPAWDIDEDVVVITALPQNNAFSRWRDSVNTQNGVDSLNQNMSFTQTWRVHFTVLGPNSYIRAVLLVDAFSFNGDNWVSDWLAAPKPPYNPNGFFVIADYYRPVYAPYVFQRRWWQRVDVELQFNELVIEQISATPAVGLQIDITTDTGITEKVTIG